MKKLTAKNPVKLDIASGQNKTAGFVGVDIAGADVDVIYDLENYPWTFAEDNSVTEAVCSHYIEHTKDMMSFMNELYRILIPGGKCTFYAPYYNNMRCWQDPTHTRAISEATFLYYNKEWREVNKLDHYPINCNFNFSYSYHMDPVWSMKSQEARDFAIRHYTNIINDIQVTVVSLKAN